MDKITSKTPVLSGDYAAGERTRPVPPAEASRRGDFAAGERTRPREDDAETRLHGDFAAGERTKPLAPEDVTPGTFADSED